MGFAIGFGSTEKAFETAEEQHVREFAEGCMLNEDYVTDEIAEQIRRDVEKRGAEYRQQADKYKTSESYPDRYSYFWPIVLHDASRVVVILRFSHINRRHGMSPDGWAMMQNERLVHIPKG